jgi:hypothetical protein
VNDPGPGTSRGRSPSAGRAATRGVWRFVSLIALLAAGCAPRGRPPGEPTPHGKLIRGTVTDDIGTPIAGAEIFAGQPTAVARTDDGGQFAVRSSHQGLLAVGARQSGFRPAIDVVRVASGGGTIELGFVLTPVEFRGDSVAWARASGAFLHTEITAMQQRFSTGASAVFTWRDVDARQVQFLSQLIEGGVPGVTIRRSRTGTGRVTSSRMASPCTPLLVVDGLAWRNGGTVDDIPPPTVQTIEVYRGGSTAPMRLGFDTACGAIVITTRTGR